MFGIRKWISSVLPKKYAGVFLPASPAEYIFNGLSAGEVRRVFTKDIKEQWRVGNHFLRDGFSDWYANEIARRIPTSLGFTIVDLLRDGDIYFVLNGANILVNVDVPQDKVMLTCENLREQFLTEILKNAGYDHNKINSFVKEHCYKEPEK